MIAQQELNDLGIKTIRRGDDLYIRKEDREIEYKLSVSIATVSINSMKIHFALNITSEGTPTDVEITGLKEIKNDLKDKEIVKLADNISIKYIGELDNIEADITKTKVL